MSDSNSTSKERTTIDIQNPVEDAANETIQIDGGYQAWVTVIGGFLVLMATSGYTFSFGVYQDFYTRNNKGSASQISWIGSTQLFLLFAVGVPAGKMLDMGYYRQIMLFGTTLYSFSRVLTQFLVNVLFMLSIAHTDKYYQIFLSQAIGAGLGGGLVYVPAIALQAHYWRKKKGMAMGIVALGSSVGGIFYPIMLNQLFHGRVGFPWGVRAAAFLIFAPLFIASILMKPNPNVLAAMKTKPNVKKMFTDGPYMAMAVAEGLSAMGVFFPYFYLQLFSIEKGLNPTFAFYTLAIMNAASFPGRTLPSILADKIGLFNTFIPVNMICAVLTFSLLHIDTVGSVVVFAVLYGFFSGSWASLIAPCTASLATHPSELGMRFGISYTITGLGALIGSPVDGALLGNTFPWSKAIVFTGTVVMTGSLVMIVARHFIARKKGTQLV